MKKVLNEHSYLSNRQKKRKPKADSKPHQHPGEATLGKLELENGNPKERGLGVAQHSLACAALTSIPSNYKNRNENPTGYSSGIFDSGEFQPPERLLCPADHENRVFWEGLLLCVWL